MENIDSHVDHAQDTITEHAHAAKERWVTAAALTAGLLTAFAAISSMLCTHHDSEGILSSIMANDSWSYYSTVSIKDTFVQDHIDRLVEDGKPIPAALSAKHAKYEGEKKELEDKAHKESDESYHHMSLRASFGHAVTFFQIGIAISAIALVVRKKPFWFVGIALGLVGIMFMMQGMSI